MQVFILLCLENDYEGYAHGSTDPVPFNSRESAIAAAVDAVPNCKWHACLPGATPGMGELEELNALIIGPFEVQAP